MDMQAFDEYKGKLFYNKKIHECYLRIHRQIIRFINEEENDNFDLIIPYKRFIFFAKNENENIDQEISEIDKEKEIFINGFLMINFSAENGSDENSMDTLVKFFPSETTKLKEIYEKVDLNNRQNPDEEFENECEGDNELFTAQDFD